jgi:hypothetical protein
LPAGRIRAGIDDDHLEVAVNRHKAAQAALQILGPVVRADDD